MGCPDWHTAMHSLRLPRLLWICCPGHAGVSGNEQADRSASTADITSSLQLGRAEVLRGLRNFLNIGRPEHHSTDRLKERGVEKRSGRQSTLRGREQFVFNQTNNNNNDNNRIQRHYSRFFTVSSQRRELSPTRTLKWPGLNRVQIACNASSAYHVQVSCYVPLGTKEHHSY